MFPRSYRIGELTWVINDACVYRLEGDLHPLPQKESLGHKYHNRAIFQVLLEISRNADPFG